MIVCCGAYCMDKKIGLTFVKNYLVLKCVSILICDEHTLSSIVRAGFTSKKNKEPFVCAYFAKEYGTKWKAKIYSLNGCDERLSYRQTAK